MRIWDAPLGLHHCNPAGRRLRTETCRGHYHIYLHHQQGLLQDFPYLSIRAAPSFRANQTWGGRGVWAGEDSQEGGEKGTRGALGSFGSKATPGPAPCSVHSFLPGQPRWMAWVDGGGKVMGGPFLFLSLPFLCIPPILIIPRPPGSSFLLDRAWCPCPCPPLRPPPPPSHSSISQIPGPCLCPRACPALSSSISYPRPGLTD